MPAVERADFARSADALPCGDRVMAQDENVVISEPPRPPPDASDEPTVVDAAGRKNDDTVSSDTAVTAARSSGVTTASPLILQGEELARAIALLRLVVLAGLAGLGAVWLVSVVDAYVTGVDAETINLDLAPAVGGGATAGLSGTF